MGKIASIWKKSKVQGRMWLWERVLLLMVVLANAIIVWRSLSISFPFSFSAPVITLLADFLSLFGLDFDTAVRWVFYLFYILGPVSLYALVKEISGRRMSAALAAVIYSLPIFRARYESLVLLGDGAHVAGLTLIPLAAFLLLRFLRKGKFAYAAWTSISVVLVALTSPFALFVSLFVLGIITFSEMLLGFGRLKFLRLVLVLVISVGLSAFWYNPQFIHLTFSSVQGQAVFAALKNFIPLSFFIVPVLGTFGFLIFDKREHLQPLFVALGLTAVFGLIAFAENLAEYAVFSQNRYFPEVSFSLAFLWGVVGTSIYELIRSLPVSRWFPVPFEKRALLQRVAVVLFVSFSLVLSFFFPLRESLNGGSRRVLGRTATVVTGIGEMRKETRLGDRILGYSITTFTIAGMVGMWRWVKRQEELEETKKA